MDKKLTDREIVKALEDIIKILDFTQIKSGKNVLANALDLINRPQDDVMFLSMQCDELQAENEKWQSGYMTQKQEIANLEIELKAMRGAANSYKAENERLQKAIEVQEIMLGNQDYTIKRAKAEAYKEFADRLKENCKVIGAPLITNRIDNLLKELVGEV